jgi:cytochrome c
MPKAILALLISAVLIVPAFAGSAQRGAIFAQKNCAICHAVGIGGDSPNPRSPPFREIAHKYPPRDLEEALGEGIVVSHDMPMPQFELDPNDIEDLIAYLEKLRQGTRIDPASLPKQHLIRRTSLN